MIRTRTASYLLFLCVSAFLTGWIMRGYADAMAFAQSISCGSPATLSITIPSAFANAYVGVPYSQTLQAAGGTTCVSPATPTWTFTGLPSGLTNNGGTVTGTPTAAGTSNVTVKVSDCGIGSQKQTTPAIPAPITAFALKSASAISITSGVTTVAVGANTAAQTAQATFSDGSMFSNPTIPIIWQVAGPASINSSTGIVTGSQPGGTASVTANFGGQSSPPETVSVTGGTPPSTPTIVSTSPLPSGFATISYPSVTLVATGGSGGCCTWAPSGSIGSSGLSMSSGGVITGSSPVAGTYTVSVTATDGSSNVSPAVVFSITINSVNSPVQLSLSGGGTSISLANSGTAQVVAKCSWSGGSSFSQCPTNITYASSAPTVVSVSASGLITAATSGSGSANITASVPGCGSCTSNAVAVTVTTSLTISTPAILPGSGSSPAAFCDLNFPCPTTQLAASGGTPPYTWTITSGAPTGCGSSVSSVGVYMCTPTASGTFSSFIIKVTDSLSNTASKTFTQVVGSISSRTASASPLTITQGATSQAKAIVCFSDGGCQNITIGSAGLQIINSWTDGGTCGSVSDCPVTVNPPVGADLRAIGNQGANNSSGITFTDNLSQSWTTDQTNTSYGPREFAVGHFFNTASGETTVHCHTAAAASHMTCMVIAVTGDNQTFDSAGHLTSFLASTPATSLNSASFTSANASDLICFFVGLATDQSGASFSATSPFSMVNSTARLGAACETVSSIQTLQATINWTTSTQNSGGIIDALEGSAGQGAAWASGSSCTVSSNGLVTGTQTGACTVSFTYGGGSSNTVTVTVNGAQTDTALCINAAGPGTCQPASSSGTVGGKVQFTAIGNVTGSSYTSTATWTPTNSAIAVLDSSGNGLFDCLAAGTTTVNASFGTLTGGTATLTCNSQVTSPGELLAGCSYTGSGGCPVPAGWSLAFQQDFECTNSHASPANPGCGQQTSNVVSTGGGFQTNLNHSAGGQYSWGGTYTGDASAVSLYYNPNGGLLGNINSVYISYWNQHNNFQFGNSDYYIANLVPGNGHNGGNSTTACNVGDDAQGNANGPFALSSTYLELSVTGDPSSIPCQGGTITLSNGNAAGGTIPADNGAWDHYELYIHPNTFVTLPIANAPFQVDCNSATPTTAGCGDGEIEIWLNGNVVAHEKNVNLNGGSTSPTNVNSDPEIQIGGIITAFSNSSGGRCTSFGVAGCPSIGTRNIDDIIVLKQ